MGCCGNRAPQTDYEVTMRDGTVKRVSTLGEARILARSDVSEGTRPSPTIKAVSKKVS